ncbi:antitoxin [Methylobacterium oxalidis]|uniref:antitoxin n=1 Tax=Methylobacterium oxalidis TaxID=944322 RepID=UPI003316441B
MERRVSLFRNGRNQAVRIPRGFELPGTRAVMRKDGSRLIIEPVRRPALLEVLRDLPALDEAELLEEVEELAPRPVDL